MKLAAHIILIGSIFTGALLCNTPKAIVIGASRGIGKEVAKRLASQGYTVGLASRNLEALTQLQQDLDGDSVIKKIDVTKSDAQLRLQELINQMNGVDLVVISSGIWPEWPESVDDSLISWQKAKDTIDTNVTGFVSMANIALNHFIERGCGHLVGISSIDAVRGAAECPAYCASKAFISTYMEGMRNRFLQNKQPIYVTDIRPGYVGTYDVMEEAGFWVCSPEQAAKDICQAIDKKKKVVYTTKRWWIIAKILQLCPDYIYNKIGWL